MLKNTCFGRRTVRRQSILGCRTWIVAVFACLLLGGSLSQADTVGYWRFGDDGGFLNDSGPNNLDLRQLDATDVATIAGFSPNRQEEATQEAILGSGPGSLFDDAIAGNTQLAHLPPLNPSNPGDSNSGDGFVVDDEAVLSVTNFTIEALIHRESSTDPSIPVWNIAGQFNEHAGFGGAEDTAWKFFVRDGEGTSRFGKLELQVSSTGQAVLGNWLGLEEILSNIVLDPDKDYYVAASFDLSNQIDGVTFYAKNLTDGDPMQIDKMAHSLTVLYDSVGPYHIGRGSNPWQHQGDGFIDEVRLSNVVLDPSELLVPAVGDFDGDDDVDGADFLKWQRDSGDAAELTLWQDNFGTPAAPAVAAVPEPASWILICTMMALIAPRRQHPFL